MRHLHTGRKLGVDADHRRARLRSLSLALIENDAIRTTPARAKELRWFADRIVTLAKRNDLAGRRRIVQILGSTQTFRTGHNRVRLAVEKVYSDLVPRFKTRNGGYTQMLRIARRRAGDNAELCLMRYLPVAEAVPAKRASKKPKDKELKAKAKDSDHDHHSHKKPLFSAKGKTSQKESPPKESPKDKE